MAAPAHFFIAHHAIRIDQFDLRSSTRELTLSGTMGVAGPQDVTFTARDLDVSLIQPLLRSNQGPTGTIGAKIAITGTAAAPIIRANFTGQNLAMNQQRIGDLSTDTLYNPGAADIKVALYQDRTHRMTLVGTVPVTLDWVHGFHLHLGNDLAVRLYSAGLSLDGLAALAPRRTIKNASGQFACDLALRGLLTYPAINCTIALDNLGGEVLPLGLKINDSFVHMRITPTLFTLEQMSIDASDGSITGSGTVALTNYTPGAVDLGITIQQFPAIHNQHYQAVISSLLHVGGTSNAPHYRRPYRSLERHYPSRLGFSHCNQVQPR
jgi:autotransporter translocation and assembly factor TamB